MKLKFLFIFIFISMILSWKCSTDGTLLDDQESIWCPQAKQYLTEPQCEALYKELDSILCSNQPLNVKGGFSFKYEVNPALKVSYYEYNILGSTIQNCDFKFLEYNDFKADSVELVVWRNHNVGAAGYTVVKKQYLGLDKYLYWCKQWRETFNGQQNPNGICDGGGNPSLPNFYVRFTGCKEYEIGDSIGLRKVIKT